MSERLLGVLGGSGLYGIPELQEVTQHRVSTPFGEPSAPYLSGRIGDTRVIFLARHGEGHRLMPSEVNYRANIHGFRQLGVRHLISVSAVGSLREDIRPGDMVLPDQFIDRTRQRQSTFFGDGAVIHVQFGDPICPNLRGQLAEILGQMGLRFHEGGTYVAIEGPAFSTRAESELYRSWKADVIGMTAMPEARLAREAEMCYSVLALSTDYDCWHEAEAEVSVEAVVAVLRQNVNAARRVIAEAARRFPPAGTCRCQRALENTLISDPARISTRTREKLQLLAGRFFDPE